MKKAISEPAKVAAEVGLSMPLSKKVGTGYGGDKPCSKGIFDDIARSEVLIGENELEIILRS